MFDWGAWFMARFGSEVAVMFRKKTPTPILLEAILRRVAEINHKIKQTDTWLHPTLAKDARERELLVAKANEQFNADPKHEWG
jgi:hypothetical protein